MVERDLWDLLEPFTGDDPSPEVVDQIWRRLDSELRGDVPTVTVGSEEVQIMTLEMQEVDAPARRPRWMIGALVAAAVLVVVGLVGFYLNDDGAEPGEGADVVAAGSEGQPSGSEGQPSSSIVVPEAEPGPVEQLLRIYFAGGIEAAAASDLAHPGLVYGRGGADDPAPWGTWFMGLAGYWVDPGLELECVDADADEVVCLVEAEIPMTRIIGRRGQLLLEGRVNADGQVVSILPMGNSEERALGAYERWLFENHPEVQEACRDTGDTFVCYFPDDLLDEYAASDDFDPGEPEPLNLQFWIDHGG